MISECNVLSICWRFDPAMPLYLEDGLEIHTPEELVRHYSQQAKWRTYIGEIIYEGVLETWLKALERKEDAAFVARTVRDRKNNQALGVHVVCWKFDQTMPLWLEDGMGISTPEELPSYFSHDSNRRMQVEALLYDGVLEAWLDTLGRKEDAAYMVKTVVDMAQNRELGVYAVCWRFDSLMPIWLEDGIAIREPQELAHHLSQNWNHQSRVSEIVYKRILDTWLDSLGRRDDAVFVASIVRDHAQDREYGVYSISLRLDPEFPLPFSDGKFAYTPKELVLLIDHSSSWERGKYLLINRWIETWLDSGSQERLGLSDKVKEIISRKGLDWDRNLEAVLHVLDPTLSWPQPVLEPTLLDLGNFFPGDSVQGNFQIRNAGRGYMWGSIFVQGNHDNVLKIETLEFYGQQSQIVVTATSREIKGWNGAVRHTGLEVMTPSGSMMMQVRYRVKSRWKLVWKNALLGGVFSGSALYWIFVAAWSSEIKLYGVLMCCLACIFVGIAMSPSHVSRKVTYTTWIVLSIILSTLKTIHHKELIIRQERETLELSRKEQVKALEQPLKTPEEQHTKTPLDFSKEIAKYFPADQIAKLKIYGSFGTDQNTNNKSNVTTSNQDVFYNKVIEMIEYSKDDDRVMSIKDELKKNPSPARGNKTVARKLNKDGLLALKNNQYNNAEQIFQEAQKADSGDVEINNNYAYAQIKSKKYDDAIQRLISILAKMPTRSAAWANLGEAFAYRNQKNLSIGSFINCYRFSENRNNTIKYIKNLQESSVDDRLKEAITDALQEFNQIK